MLQQLEIYFQLQWLLGENVATRTDLIIGFSIATVQRFFIFWYTLKFRGNVENNPEAYYKRFIKESTSKKYKMKDGKDIVVDNVKPYIQKYK